jgi:diaminopimelate epimerase
MQRVEFTKAHCGGNDFVLVDERYINRPLSELAMKACARKTGVGADGFLTVGKKHKLFSLRYLNRDGSEARFCGNGILCAAKWVRENGCKTNPISFSWNDKEYMVWEEGETWKAQMPSAVNLRLDVVLGSGATVDCVTVGVPHAVRFLPEVEGLDVQGEGREIRSDPVFLPDGVNVDFCALFTRERMRLRTYERGVEAETLSCGSGAAAACFVAHKRGMVERKVAVLARGGSLTVHVDHEDLMLVGRPETVYRGILEMV